MRMLFEDEFILEKEGEGYSVWWNAVYGGSVCKNEV